MCSSQGEEKNIDFELLRSKLEYASTSALLEMDYSVLDSKVLTEILIQKHHNYVRRTLPVLTAYLDKVSRVHGQSHPELITINSLFRTMGSNLLEHIEEEEQTVFPILMACEDEESHNAGRSISKMMHEHFQFSWLDPFHYPL